MATEAEVPAPIDVFILDELLEKIFSYLSIIELIIIERVSKRWREISRRSWKHKKKILINHHLGHNFPLIRFKEILRRGGKYINHISMRGIVPTYIKFSEDTFSVSLKDRRIPEKILFQSISRYCKSLRNLEVAVYTCDGENLSYLDKSLLGNLKSLRIYFTKEGESDSAEETVSSLIKEAINLEEIHLSSEENIKGCCFLNLSQKCRVLCVKDCHEIDDQIFIKVLERLPNLEKLNIYNTAIKPETISKISSQLAILSVGCNKPVFTENKFSILSLENLRKLDIRETDDINNKKLSSLIEKCPLLEELNLESLENVNNKGFRAVGKLKNLKRLNVNNDKINNDGFVYLAHSLKKLEKVSCRLCEKLKTTGLLALIESCPKLSKLDIIGVNVDDSFFVSALRCVDKRPESMSLTIKSGDICENISSLKPSIDRPLKYNYCKVLEVSRIYDGKWSTPVKKIWFVDSSGIKKDS